MKISKHVRSLKLLKSKYGQAIDISNLESAQKALEMIKKGRIYAHIKSVSRSGMSRRILFFYVEKNRIIRCTPEISWLVGKYPVGKYMAGEKHISDEGLLVRGCGMDMIFHTLYNAMPYKDARKWAQGYNTL